MEKLTDREAEVASLISSGASNHDIAKTLGIAEKTVRNHLHTAFKKAGVRNRIQLSNWLASANPKKGAAAATFGRAFHRQLGQMSQEKSFNSPNVS